MDICTGFRVDTIRTVHFAKVRKCVSKMATYKSITIYINALIER